MPLTADQKQIVEQANLYEMPYVRIAKKFGFSLHDVRMVVDVEYIASMKEKEKLAALAAQQASRQKYESLQKQSAPKVNAAKRKKFKTNSGMNAIVDKRCVATGFSDRSIDRVVNISLPRLAFLET